MQRIFHDAFVFLMLSVSLIAGAGEQEVRPLAQEAFGQCQFSIQKLVHLKLRETSYGSAEDSYCAINFDFPRGLISDAGITIFLFGKGLFELERRSEGQSTSGFAQDDRGRWHFQGTELLLSPKMLKTSFTEERDGEETLLVGEQLIKGNISQGGPISVPGIRILRIAPQFVVSVDLNFQPLHYEKQNKGSKQLREAVSRELVDIVRSVQITPGVPGPTVRSKSAP